MSHLGHLMDGARSLPSSWMRASAHLVHEVGGSTSERTAYYIESKVCNAQCSSVVRKQAHIGQATSSTMPLAALWWCPHLGRGPLAHLLELLKGEEPVVLDVSRSHLQQKRESSAVGCVPDVAKVGTSSGNEAGRPERRPNQAPLSA